MKRLRRIARQLAIHFLHRRSEHGVPSDARLVWLWVERVEMVGALGSGHEFKTVTSPAYD